MEFGLEAGVWFQCREAARFWHVWSRNNFTFSEKKSQPLQMQHHSPQKANSNPFQNGRFFDEQSTTRVRISRAFGTSRNLLGVVATKQSRHRFAQNKRAGKRPARFQTAVAALNSSNYFISRVGSARGSKIGDGDARPNGPEPSTNKLHAPSSAAHKGNTAGRPLRC
jgi:hypothetical protein